jgi:hypothetical protein
MVGVWVVLGCASALDWQGKVWEIYETRVLFPLSPVSSCFVIEYRIVQYSTVQYNTVSDTRYL